MLPVVPPAPARSSRRHLSRSMPVRATHLLGTSVVAPVDAAPEALVPPPTLDPDVPAPALVPALPEAEPDDEEDWAIATEDRARSAAAVAAVRVFNIIWNLLEMG